jgi:hypothetical protein
MKSKFECNNKHEYPSKDEAYKAAYSLLRESGGASILRPYKCKYCKKFHLTSSVK